MGNVHSFRALLFVALQRFCGGGLFGRGALLDQFAEMVDADTQDDRQPAKGDECREHQVDLGAAVGEQHEVAQAP